MSLLVVVSSPSGGGKTTACNGLLARDPRLRRAITCTTRPPRAGETEGRDYYFLSPEEFALREKAGKFFETATVHGQRYGSLRREVDRLLQAGHDVILTLDVQGAESVRRVAERDPTLRAALVTVFLMPPSLEVLEKRLRNRGTESAAEIQRRLEVARKEIQEAGKYHHVFTSESIEDDIARLQFIIETERTKRNDLSRPNSTRATSDSSPQQG